MPDIPRTQIAHEIGMSREMVAYYLSGRVKSFVERPAWAESLFNAAGLLAHGDIEGAALAFRELSDKLIT